MRRFEAGRKVMLQCHPFETCNSLRTLLVYLVTLILSFSFKVPGFATHDTLMNDYYQSMQSMPTHEQCQSLNVRSVAIKIGQEILRPSIAHSWICMSVRSAYQGSYSELWLCNDAQTLQTQRWNHWEIFNLSWTPKLCSINCMFRTPFDAVMTADQWLSMEANRCYSPKLLDCGQVQLYS